MIVRFVLEHYEPALGLVVDEYHDFHRASVDLVGQVEVIEVPFFFQHFRRDRRHVHKADVLVVAPLVEFAEKPEVFVERRLNVRVERMYLYIAKLR